MRKSVVAIVVLSLVALAGCSKNSVSPVSPLSSSPTTGQVQVMMTDAPGAFDAVNLVVTEVAAYDGVSWQVIQTQTSNVNLLSLQNGVFATVAASAVPAGHYTQLRLKLGQGSNVVVDGVTYPLNVPSGMASGFKVMGSFDVIPGGVVSMQMDFDAAKSVSQLGNGSWMLSPVIRMLPASESGAVSGQITLDGADAGVQILGADGTEVASTTATSSGSFKIAVLPEGWYTVVITSTTGRTHILQDVHVLAGQTVNFGQISFPS